LRKFFQELRELEERLEDLHRQLQKHRLLYMKADAKGLDSSAKLALYKRIERENADGRQLLQAKVDLSRQCQLKLDAMLKRFDSLLSTCSTPVPLAPSHADFLADLHRLMSSDGGPLAKEADTFLGRAVSICYCQQPPIGDIVTCQSAACRVKRFHGACVGASSASPNWTCRECCRQKP
jgi:hypothetical protein